MQRIVEADIEPQQALETGSVPMRPCADDRPFLAIWGGRRPHSGLTGSTPKDTFSVSSQWITGSEPMRPSADDRPILAIWGGRRPESGLSCTQPWETFIVTSHISASHRIAGYEPMRPSADDRPFLATWGGRRPDSESTGATSEVNSNVTSHRPASHRFAGSEPMMLTESARGYSVYNDGDGRPLLAIWGGRQPESTQTGPPSDDEINVTSHRTASHRPLELRNRTNLRQRQTQPRHLEPGGRDGDQGQQVAVTTWFENLHM